MDGDGEHAARVLVDLGPHGAQWLGHAPHGPAPQGGVARQGRREALAREHPEQEARGRSGVAAVQPGAGRGEPRAPDGDDCPRAHGRDPDAELAQDAGCALHILPRQEAIDFAGPAATQRREHQGPVRDALVTRWPDGAPYLQASALRRHSAPRASQRVTVAASAVSRARSSSPSGSSSARSAGSTSSRFMSRISDQSRGALAARRVVSRAPAPSVAPGGAASARKWASSDATTCGRWLVSAS